MKQITAVIQASRGAGFESMTKGEALAAALTGTASIPGVSEAIEVEVAGDGRAALDCIRRQRPDLVIADVMMPVLDGFELLRSLRQLKQTPVIMLTARDRIEDRVRGLHDGADDYLVKPFSFLELLARLQDVGEIGLVHPGAADGAAGIADDGVEDLEAAPPRDRQMGALDFSEHRSLAAGTERGNRLHPAAILIAERQPEEQILNGDESGALEIR